MSDFIQDELQWIFRQEGADTGIRDKTHQGDFFDFSLEFFPVIANGFQQGFFFPLPAGLLLFYFFKFTPGALQNILSLLQGLRCRTLE